MMQRVQAVGKQTVSSYLKRKGPESIAQILSKWSFVSAFRNMEAANSLHRQQKA